MDNVMQIYLIRILGYYIERTSFKKNIYESNGFVQ